MVAVLVRLPAAIHQSGGQDEDYFAVAGWSLLQSGVPRIPYAPSLNVHGVFYKADEILYALPPGFFAAEALVFRAVGPSYAAGRLTSLLAGAAAVVGLFYLARRWFSPGSALFAATLFAFSRPFLFPATTARPDMLCTALLTWGFVALTRLGGRVGRCRESHQEGPSSTRPKEPPPSWGRWRVMRAGGGAALQSAAFRWWDSRHRPTLPALTTLAGLLIGLALLTHPFALLGVILGLARLLAATTTRRVLHTLLFLAAVGAAFSLWLPLIAKDPQLFRTQFGNNVLGRAGPGLLARILWPWEALWYHAKLFVELAGPWQAALFGGSLIAATVIELRCERRRWGWLLLTWASVIGLGVLQGAHPSKGYWSFPAAFLCLAVARAVEPFGRWRPAAIALCLALLVPGGGWKAAGVYLRHWGDPDYSHPEAVQQLLDELPPKARYLVDVGCVFDWHLTGRPTLLALDIPQYFSSAGAPFDFLIVSRTGLDQGLPEALGATRRLLTVGRRDDPLAVYFEVWRK